MGLLKKIFKPVSKVLDKIIPNEIKPALPYLAAFAPYMAPGIMGIGGNTMLSRALMSGGLNIGAQLAQEGSEGDINLLSAGLGALQGAMTTPGSVGGRTIGDTGASYSQYMGGDKLASVGTPSAQGILEAKAAGMQPGMMKSGLEALSGGSEFLTGAAKTLQTNPFSVEGLKAAAIPFAQGSADAMYAEANRDLKDLANQVVDDMGGGYTDDAYRAAIRKSMTAYGATEEEIIDAIEAAGYRSGGRVALRGGGDPNFGGITEAVENVNEEVIEEKKGGMLMEIAKVIFRLTPPGAGIMAAKDAYDMYQNLEDEDKEKVQEFGKKALEMAKWTHPVGIAMKAGKAAGNKISEWNQPQENKMAKGGVPSVLPKGVEADYRGGGFIPIGSKERADDVPARLSENEFVMTADAVRAAGGGSVNQGAKRMYNLMHNLEARA